MFRVASGQLLEEAVEGSLEAMDRSRSYQCREWICQELLRRSQLFCCIVVDESMTCSAVTCCCSFSLPSLDWTPGHLLQLVVSVTCSVFLDMCSSLQSICLMTFNSFLTGRNVQRSILSICECLSDKPYLIPFCDPLIVPHLL